MLPCDPEVHVLTGPHGIHDCVVAGEQLLTGGVRAELHVPEETHARMVEGLGQRGRDRFDARVVGRDAIAQQPIGRGQPVDDIDCDRHLLLGQQRLRGKQPGGSRTDHGNPSWVCRATHLPSLAAVCGRAIVTGRRVGRLRVHTADLLSSHVVVRVIRPEPNETSAPMGAKRSPAIRAN